MVKASSKLVPTTRLILSEALAQAIERKTCFEIRCMSENCKKHRYTISGKEIEEHDSDSVKSRLAIRWFAEGWRAVRAEGGEVTGAYCPGCAKRYLE